MGSAPSTPARDRSDDPWWPIENENLDLNPSEMDTAHDDSTNTNSVEGQRAEANCSKPSISIVNEIEISETENVLSNEMNESNVSTIENCAISKERQQSLDEFKEELRIKREMRTNAISELRNEISNLRQQLAEEKEITKQLKQIRNKENLCQICDSIYNSLESDVKSNQNIQMKIEENCESIDTNNKLRTQLAELQFNLQNANAEILTLSTELAATKNQAKSLKEVIAASKEIIGIRETELYQLKSKLKDIEDSLAERELHVMSENLRQEYDRQLANIRNLRALYEERARISAAEKENLNRQLETRLAELNSEIEKNKNLEDHISSLETDLKATTVDLYATKEKLSYYKSENRGLCDEMTVVNQLFGQLLSGFNGSNSIDIDKLTSMLEENRDLLNDITNKEDCKEGAAQIPKLIFDLVSQAENNGNDLKDGDTATAIDSNATKLSSTQEIIHNLPKVWRVLTELLNHQQLKPVELKENNKGEHCYKSIETPSGPQMVLSVSKTYIRLKDLIMEKKFLQKETKKLKNLNSHLEYRLNEQEQRLSAVTIELNKTWNFVGRMQRQHRQLHTHEQVLRYQLQQKRRMLSELKEELEYCRKKWALAKEKNNESQSQWETLRHEFIKRKENDLNMSGESGYSDGPVSEDDDDEDSSLSIEQPRCSRLKKKINVDNFLNCPEKDRKMIRIHSVSPIRNGKINILRRNSDSDITQYATAEFQLTSDIIQPMVSIVCIECGENCVKHSVHFDTDEGETINHVNISEPVIHGGKHEPSNAQKLITSKSSSSKTLMSYEVRKSSSTKTTPNKNEETLEEMFVRLSGAKKTETENQCNETNDVQINCSTIINVPSTSSINHNEHERKRLARIERLEGQCKQLLTQVTRASNRGDDLKKRINDAHSRYSTKCEITTVKQNDTNETEPSTSGIKMTQKNNHSKTDEECLRANEKEYLSRRDERLKRLEAESQAYINKIKSINRRATDVDTKLEFLHGRYGSETQIEEDTNATEISCKLLSNQNNLIESTQPSSPLSECSNSAKEEICSSKDESSERLDTETQAISNQIELINGQTTDVDTKLKHLHGHENNTISAEVSTISNETHEHELNQVDDQNESNHPVDVSPSINDSTKNQESSN